MKKRTLVIGDIHGAFKALKQVLERAAVTKDDTLIFLGDYVDGWSQSFEVIAQLIKLKRTQPCFFIKGNHDAWCQEWLETGKTNDAWLFSGGNATIKSYATRNKQEIEEHLAFFQSLMNYHVDEQNDLFIHAGYASMHGPEKELYANNYRWDRTLWETAVAMDDRITEDSRFYPKRLKLFREIYIGHTPTLNYDQETPMHAVNVWNIDTGAGFYGKLTALDITSKKFWQSDPVKTLYPDEKGRG